MSHSRQPTSFEVLFDEAMIIVWIGGQIDVHPERHLPGNPIFAATGVLEAAHQDALQAAARNNVAVYPVDPVGLTPRQGQEELIRVSSCVRSRRTLAASRRSTRTTSPTRSPRS